MTTTCPQCGSTNARRIAPNYFECQGTLAVPTGAPPSGAYGPTTQSRVCGHRYQTVTGSSAGVLPQCSCGMFAVGTCYDCGKPLCGDHNVGTGTVLCHACRSVRRERRAAEDVTAQKKFATDRATALEKLRTSQARLVAARTATRERVTFTTTYVAPGGVVFPRDRKRRRAEASPLVGQFMRWLKIGKRPVTKLVTQCEVAGWWIPGIEHQSSTYDIGPGHGTGYVRSMSQAFLVTGGQVAIFQLDTGMGVLGLGDMPYLSAMYPSLAALADHRSAWSATQLLQFLEATAVVTDRGDAGI